VIQASINPDPAPALKATRELLKSEPQLLSARITEIKLLVKAGKTAEAELRAKALISAHPELKEIPKIRAWANLPEGTTSEHEDYSR
jgi:predicted Zn-dependent protease